MNHLLKGPVCENRKRKMPSNTQLLKLQPLSSKAWVAPLSHKHCQQINKNLLHAVVFKVEEVHGDVERLQGLEFCDQVDVQFRNVELAPGQRSLDGLPGCLVEVGHLRDPGVVPKEVEVHLDFHLEVIVSHFENFLKEQETSN